MSSVLNTTQCRIQDTCGHKAMTFCIPRFLIAEIVHVDWVLVWSMRRGWCCLIFVHWRALKSVVCIGAGGIVWSMCIGGVLYEPCRHADTGEGTVARVSQEIRPGTLSGGHHPRMKSQRVRVTAGDYMSTRHQCQHPPSDDGSGFSCSQCFFVHWHARLQDDGRTSGFPEHAPQRRS